MKSGKILATLLILILVAGAGLALWVLPTLSDARINTRFEGQLGDGTNCFGLLLPKGDYLISVATEPHILRDPPNNHVAYSTGNLILQWPDHMNRSEIESFVVTNNQLGQAFLKRIRITNRTEHLLVTCDLKVRGDFSNYLPHAYLLCRFVK